jgi:hypothetical protein
VGADGGAGRGGPRASDVRLWALALAGGLLAGLVAWGAGEANYGRFQSTFVKPPGWDKMNGYEKDAYRSTDEIRQRPSVESKNVALAFGGLGAALGVALGLAGGLARGSVPGALNGGAAGAVAGVIATAGASAAAVPVFYRWVDPDMGLAVPALTHLALFAAVGVGGGLGLGLGLGGRGDVPRGLLGGLLGGVAGAVAYELAVALAFADMRVYDPIPKDLSPEQRMVVPRLVMHLSAALSVAILAAACARAGKGETSGASKADGG